MNKISITICLIFLTNFCFGQNPDELYLEGVDSMKAENYIAAINLFEKVTLIQPENPYAWYNIAIAKGNLGQNEDALENFEKSAEVYPSYKKAWLNIGTQRKYLTDYEGSFKAYFHALELDNNYGDAYYNLALLYDLYSKRDSACLFYAKAMEFGVNEAKGKVERCSDQIDTMIFPILRLTKTAKNSAYGFIEDNPVKVGSGPDGGPANQRAYLNLLRDAQGKRINYERLASCCPYKSKNGMMGMGLLDIYQITYYDKSNTEKTTKVYISFYDYEEPQILNGFQTIKRK